MQLLLLLLLKFLIIIVDVFVTFCQIWILVYLLLIASDIVAIVIENPYNKEWQ